MEFRYGAYPTMITPYKADGSVDLDTAAKYVRWYFQNGCAGIFAVCQSSEIAFLTVEERVALNARVYAEAKALEKEYGKKPIIYTTTHIYGRYIQGVYDNPIWIADHSLPAALPDGNPWLFCQYSYEGELDGYSGSESHIDLDVFNGSPEELQNL
jgi:GH25 family lysozyme M1 (1,4-beta-N-acetylmuramidase)